MPNFQTHYTFVIEVKGDQAIQQAQTTAAAIQKALSQTGQSTQAAMPMLQLAQALQGVTDQATRLGKVVDFLAITVANLNTSVVTLSQNMGVGGVQASQNMTKALQKQAAAAQATTAQQNALNKTSVAQTAGAGATPRAKFPSMAWVTQFTAGVNQATKQFWGLRRLGFGIETLGRGIEQSAQQWAESLMTAANAYLSLDMAAGRAEIALRIQGDLTDNLREGILDLSTEMALLKPDELARGVQLWAEGTNIQVRSQEDLNQVLETAADIQRLVVLNNGDLGQTTEAVGAAMNEFGLEMSDVKEITEGMNFVAQTTFASLGDIGESLKLVGPLAAQVGDDFTTVTTALGIMADVNIRGSMAGRALRQTYRGLTQDTEANNKAMNKSLGLAEDMGDAWRTLIFPGGQFVGLDELMTRWVIATEDMTNAERAMNFSLVATANELPGLLALEEQQRIGRENGFRAIKAQADERQGIISKDVVAMRQWRDAQEGIPVSSETATEMVNRQWDELEQKDRFRAERMQRRWEATFIKFGEDIVEFALPAVELWGDRLIWVKELIESIPGGAGFAIAFTGVSGAIGKIASGAGVALRHFANVAIITDAWGIKLSAIAAVLKGVALPLGALGAVSAIGVPLLAKAERGGIDAIAPNLREGLKKVMLENRVLRTQFKLLETLYFPLGMAQLLGPEVSAKEDLRTLNFKRLVGIQEDLTEVEAERSRIVRETNADYNRQLALTMKLDFIARGLEKRSQEVQEQVRLDIVEDYAEKRVEIETNADKQIEGATRGATIARIQIGLEQQQAIEDNAARRLQIEQDLQAQILEINVETQRRIVDAINAFQMATARANRNFALREARTQEDAARRRDKDNAEFFRREGEIAEDLLGKRQEATEDFQRNEQKAARDHHLTMQRLERDHRDNLIDLLEARDVQGIVKEMRSYRRRKEDTETDFQVGQGDRRAEFDRRRAEDEEDIEKDRELRLAALLRKQQDEDDAAAFSATRRQEDFARTEADRVAALELNIQGINENAQQRKEALKQASDEELADLKTAFEADERERKLAAFRRIKALHRTIILAESARRDALIQNKKDQDAEIALLKNTDEEEEKIYQERLLRQAEFIEARQLANRGFIEDDLLLPYMVFMRSLLQTEGRGFIEDGDGSGGAVPSYVYKSEPTEGSLPTELPQGDWWEEFLGLIGQRQGKPSRQAGGYVSPGLFRMHANEFVLNQDTTSFLERRFGRLDQGVFTSGQGLGGDGVTINMPMTFHGTRRQDANFMRKAMRKEAAFVLNSMAQKSRGNNAYPV